MSVDSSSPLAKPPDNYPESPHSQRLKVEELKNLPDGAAIFPMEAALESYELGLQIKKILCTVKPGEARRYLLIADRFREIDDPERIMLTLLNEQDIQDKTFCLKKILEHFPSLCWYRGGSVPSSGDIVLDSENGYLGLVMGALHYAEQPYIGPKAITSEGSNPSRVLFVIPLEKIVKCLEDLQRRAIVLRSEHGYDFCIGVGSDYESYKRWCRDAITAYALPSLQELKDAEKIMREKSVVLENKKVQSSSLHTLSAF